MSVTVPAILLQSPFWRTKRVETLASFATGQPISGSMLDVILEEAGWLATRTKGYAAQALYEREDAAKHRSELADAAAKLHAQIEGVVVAQKRAKEEEKARARKAREKEWAKVRKAQEEARKAQEEEWAKARKAQGEAMERARKARKAQEEQKQQARNTKQEEMMEARRAERERARKAQEDERRAQKLKAAEERVQRAMAWEIEAHKQLHGGGKKRNLSWLDDLDGSTRADDDDASAASRAERIPTASTRRSTEKEYSFGQMCELMERMDRESRERQAKNDAETKRQKEQRDEVASPKAKGDRITIAKVATTQSVPNSATKSSKTVLTPTKTTPVTKRSTPSLIADAKASVPSSKGQAELPWTTTPSSSSSQAEAGPSTAASRTFDRSRPYNPLMDPYPVAGVIPPRPSTSTSVQPVASSSRTSKLTATVPSDPTPPSPHTSAADLKDSIVKAEETLTEHIESLRESVTAQSIEHDDMRRAIGRVEAKRKAERAERDRKAGELGLSVGKLENRVCSLEFKDYYCADEWEWNHKQGLLAAKRQKAADRIEQNGREITIFEVLAAPRVEDMERKSSTQDERTKACGSVVAQFAQRTDALEAGLKDIMATLEKRGMAVPQGTNVKRQRTA